MEKISGVVDDKTCAFCKKLHGLPVIAAEFPPPFGFCRNIPTVEDPDLPGCRCYVEGPKRIQRKRTKGYKLPEGAIYVGRPTKWGNPFRTHPHALRSQAIDPAILLRCYIEWLSGDEEGIEIRYQAKEELRGKDLACWCPLDFRYCHADILLEVANA